ncbi:MAG: DUF3301 domain-containing protein [Pseudomonadales bacterium]|uniref:DUF3301 domain-containing protein n=1 Tax=Oleiphilus messinensis TaxID=141451 RepID=A0A1Y0IET7_9GAMM|nr:DUF3301 domain-containing protein [Oleiphilus messinensis]ARU58961.1 hypothetical protein OLMES_4974 [Oleiphilus messinensis]MCG8613217.1 DUF3301 domain-containing protein [Pseudomonadales bacterium]
MTLADLFWVFLLTFIAWYWWKSKEFKELALADLKRHCQRVDVKLLDDTIFLRGIWLKRDSDGRLHVWRRFAFEFATTGESRYSGKVVMLGRKITNIEMDAHRI